MSVAEIGGMGRDFFARLRTDQVRLLIGDPIPEETGEMDGLTAVIFLNPNWQSDFGGELELTPLTPGTQAKIPPAFDRLVIYHNTCYPVMLPSRGICLSATLVYKKLSSV